jgi:hypothetical protein
MNENPRKLQKGNMKQKPNVVVPGPKAENTDLLAVADQPGDVYAPKRVTRQDMSRLPGH